MTKISDSHPSEIFLNKRVFLAHCAGFAKGVGDNFTDTLEPLERIRLVIEEQPEISCSTIAPKDTFDAGPEELGNFTGNFGAIIKPTDFGGITHCAPTDSGTLPPLKVGGPRRNTNGKNLPKDLLDAIESRAEGDYNEICVRTYNVLGVFVTGPVSFATGESYTLSEVCSQFSDVPIYLRKKGDIYRYAPDELGEDKVKLVELEHLYSAKKRD